ncbi:MAG: hypothetical protein QXH67_00545 [Candidatus Bathyarchaeia archaeon]
MGYWPSRGAFVREACLEKLERRRLMARRRLEEPNRRGTNPGISPR